MKKEFKDLFERVSRACWYACNDCPQHHDLVKSDLATVNKALNLYAVIGDKE